jgi:hypothetical protein
MLLSSAETGLGLGAIINYIGIAAIVIGIGLLIAGLMLHKLIGGMTQIGAALAQMAPPPGS